MLSDETGLLICRWCVGFKEWIRVVCIMLYTKLFRNLVSQDTPSFLSLLGCVLIIVGNTLSLYLTVVLNEQEKIYSEFFYIHCHITLSFYESQAFLGLDHQNLKSGLGRSALLYAGAN